MTISTVSNEALIAECKRRGLKVYPPERLLMANFSRAWRTPEWEFMTEEVRQLAYERRHMARGLVDYMLDKGAFVFDEQHRGNEVINTITGCAILPKPEEKKNARRAKAR